MDQLRILSGLLLDINLSLTLILGGILLEGGDGLLHVAKLAV